MEKRTEIDITYKTDLPYPVPVYSVVVNYREVKNPSGIAYILLELINNSSAVDGAISDVLKQCGIPDDLHRIFESEIEGLLSDNIVAFKQKTTKSAEIRLGDLNVSDFVLTDIGKRMFTDGALPTGKNKRIRCELQYNVLEKDFSDPDASLATFSDSVLSFDSSFHNRLSGDIPESDIEDFINSKKMHFGIQSNEMIIDFVVESGAWRITKSRRNLSVSFGHSGVTFSPDTSAEKKFFEDYYDLEIVKSVLSAKSDYSFLQGTNFTEIEYGGLDAIDVIIPGDIQRFIDEPCSVFIANKKSPYERNLSASASVRIVKAKSEGILSSLGGNVHFACLTSSGDCLYYIPCKVTVPCPQFSDESSIVMDLFAKHVASKQEKEKLFDVLKDYVFNEPDSPECGNLIAYIVEHDDRSTEICKEYLDFKIAACKKVEDKIQSIIRISEYVKVCQTAKAVSTEIGDKLYKEYIADVTIDNLGLKYQILKPLLILAGRDDKSFVEDAYALLKKENVDDVTVFANLDNLGIDSSDILPHINVIEKYAEMVINGMQNSSTKLGKKFDAVRFNLWKLNDMFGVKSPMDFVSLDDNLDYSQFLSVYSAFDKAYKGIKQYKIYGAEAFSLIDDFYELYSPVSELVKLDRDAQKNVAKINAKLISGYISSSRFKDVVCNLVIKLQDILKNELKAKGMVKSQNLIDEAYDAGLINEDETKKLHNLRKCRNDYEHPNDRTRIIPTIRMCEEWRDIVFSIGKGGKK